MIQRECGLVLVIVALLLAVMLPIRQLIHHYDIADCRNFASQSGYETKFAQYTWWTWDCLAETDNGKWVSKDNLHGVNQ
jgi:hypothetical protein